jgi:hypothetical protein
MKRVTISPSRYLLLAHKLSGLQLKSVGGNCNKQEYKLRQDDMKGKCVPDGTDDLLRHLVAQENRSSTTHLTSPGQGPVDPVQFYLVFGPK